MAQEQALEGLLNNAAAADGGCVRTVDGFELLTQVEFAHVLAYRVMAYIVMVYIVMACIAMA